MYLYLGGQFDHKLFYRVRFDQLILFWGPIWQRADLSMIHSYNFNKTSGLVQLVEMKFLFIFL